MNRHRKTIAGLTAAALIAVGCGAGGGDKQAGDPASTLPLSPPATTAAAAKLTPADVKLTVKIRSRECFGSAGCNVEWTIDPAVDHAKLGDTGWLITYEVGGVEDGPQVNTFTVGADGSYDSNEVQGFGMTKSKSTKLSAKVTGVEPA